MGETFRTHDWRLLLRNIPELVDDEDIDGGGRHLKPISISGQDVQLPFMKERYLFIFLEIQLPSAFATFHANNWSSLLNFSSIDSNSMFNIEDALKSELAAICVIFFFTQVNPHVKELAVRTLSFISLGNYNVTKISVDETYFDNLMVCILSSGNEEVQLQVCKAIHFLASCPLSCLTVSDFGDGVKDVLLHLVCNLSCIIPALTYHLIEAVNGIGNCHNDMRERIVNAELSEPWLGRLWSEEKDNEPVLERICWTLRCFVRERCNLQLWDHVKVNLLPLIFDEYFRKTKNARLLRPAVCTIENLCTHGTPDQIEYLVHIGSLKFLATAIINEERSEFLLENCLDALEAILRAKDAEDYMMDKLKEEFEFEFLLRAKDAKDMIDKLKEEFEDEDEDEDEEFDEEEEEEKRKEERRMKEALGVEDGNAYAMLIPDDWWDAFLLNHTNLEDNHPLIVKAKRIVHKYRP